MNMIDLQLYPSTRRQAAGTIYSNWFDVSLMTEALIALAVTAQGSYTNETLDVTVQGQDPLGNLITLAQFTQVGNVTSSLPYVEALKLSNFGGQIRVKITTAGTSVDYTLSVGGYAK